MHPIKLVKKLARNVIIACLAAPMIAAVSIIYCFAVYDGDIQPR